jgi:hypothetical protein
MKIGANTMIRAGDFTQEHLPLIDKVAALGFDMIEILVTSKLFAKSTMRDSWSLRRLIRPYRILLSSFAFGGRLPRLRTPWQATGYAFSGALWSEPTE